MQLRRFAAAERRQIDAWISAKGRNKHGDEAGTVYTGGTPLFDERTGNVMDKYEYIVSKHPDRPWASMDKD